MKYYNKNFRGGINDGNRMGNKVRVTTHEGDDWHEEAKIVVETFQSFFRTNF